MQHVDVTATRDTESRGPTAARRRGRKLAVLFGLVCATVAALFVIPGEANDSAAPVPQTTATDGDGAEAGVQGAIVDQSDAAPSGGSGTPPGTSPGSRGRVLVVGQMTGMQLVALRPEDALREAKTTPARGITTFGRSDPVGAAISVLPIGSDLLVLATDHKQLVRLRADWRTRQVLDLAPALGAVGRGALNFGPILRLSEREVAIPVAFDRSIGLVGVDVVEWRVTRAREFSDRFASFPGACITQGGIFVSSMNHIDRFSPTTFERERSVPFTSFARAMACTEEAVWAADDATPTGRVLDPKTLGETARFAWRGSGARMLVASRGRLLGTDPESGIVFACEERSRSCTESAKVAMRASDVLEDGDVVYVTVEGPEAVAILDRNTLRTHGILRLPDLPRTLTMLPI